MTFLRVVGEVLRKVVWLICWVGWLGVQARFVGASGSKLRSLAI